MQSSVLHLSLPYGKPIIATDVGGFKEVAEKYEAVITFPRGDSDRLKQEISILLKYDVYRQDSGRRSMEYYQKIRASMTADNYAKWYTEAVGVKA
jgi:glycosyltransferase involved in cell wall biosynthesis